MRNVIRWQLSRWTKFFVEYLLVLLLTELQTRESQVMIEQRLLMKQIYVVIDMGIEWSKQFRRRWDSACFFFRTEYIMTILEDYRRNKTFRAKYLKNQQELFGDLEIECYTLYDAILSYLMQCSLIRTFAPVALGIDYKFCWFNHKNRRFICCYERTIHEIRTIQGILVFS